MKFLKKYLIFFLIILPFYGANARIIITDWNKQVEFTDYGKEITFNIKTKVELSKKGYHYREWSYFFSLGSEVEIVEAKVIGREFESSFNEEANELKFKFENAFDKDVLEFEFKYKLFGKGSEGVKYMRKGYATIPAFIAGADGELKILVPKGWTIYSYHPNFVENPYDNTYTWKGISPKDGLVESFLMTLKKARWEVSMRNTIIGQTEFKDVDMSVPLYFKNGNHVVEKLKIYTNKKNAKITTGKTKGYVDVQFVNLRSRLAQVDIKATIRSGNGRDYRIRGLDPTKHSFVDLTDASILSEIVNNIQSQANLNNTPEYIRMAEWVHNYIAYDETCTGRTMSIEDILDEKRGVCIHYSLMYEKMLRTAGIPSTAVAGLAYNIKTGKFEQHSWNLVYVNGEWIPIDPTWGIYSGKLPISHIFVYKDTVSSVNYTVFNYEDTSTISTNIREEVEFLE